MKWTSASNVRIQNHLETLHRSKRVGATLRNVHLHVHTSCIYQLIGASLSEPHIDETNARNPYIMFIIIYVWYVRHARTAIDIVQRCAVYFKRPHENICVSIVTCFFDTLNYFKGHFITTILVLCYCFSMSSTNTQSAEAKREKRLQRRRERERAHRAPYRSKQKAPKEDTLSEIEPVISSIAQGPAKNTIKID